MTDFNPFAEPKAAGSWSEVPRDEKISQIIEGLLLNEMGAVEPVFTHRYVQAKATISDMADRMSLDFQYWDRAGELRKAGKISTVDELKSQAEEMVELSSEDMRKAFSDRYQLAVQRANA